MPDRPLPTRCQFSLERYAPHPPSVIATYETAPIVGSRSAPGMQSTTALCRAHLDAETQQVVAVGGRLVSIEELPAPPAMVLPEPVGLDAIAPDRQPAQPDSVSQAAALAEGVEVLSSVLVAVEHWVVEVGAGASTVTIDGRAMRLDQLIDGALKIARPLNEQIARTPWLSDRQAVEAGR